ncbi:hypothetical protein L6452_07960 [Arctium lappa]|uniref:Uncharacterized protein n=1 Tax=Arctium lappa TaxID=4217 RepID=A0ACB9DGA5_ARCLA|nr:hypothetical protein L6452_07960 [Arctium lappa]
MDIECEEGGVCSGGDGFSGGLDGKLVEQSSVLSSKSKEVVLAFDSLQCNPVGVVDGASKSVDVYCVEDCFVPDEDVADEDVSKEMLEEMGLECGGVMKFLDIEWCYDVNGDR